MSQAINDNQLIRMPQLVLPQAQYNQQAALGVPSLPPQTQNKTSPLQTIVPNNITRPANQTNTTPTIRQLQNDAFIKSLARQQAMQKQKTSNNNIKDYVMSGLQAASLIAIITMAYYGIKSYKMQKNGESFTKNLEEISNIFQDLTNVTSLEDMALPKSLIKITETVKNGIRNSDIIKSRGGKPVRTILLYGPPGTGKTTYAKAIAKDIDADFAALDVTKLGSPFYSVTEANLNKSIEYICHKADCNPEKKIVVFIDEIDSVIMEDSSLGSKHSNDILNEFKKGFTENLGTRDNIVIIGATNLPINVEKASFIGTKTLDKPMIDRFATKILVDRPTGEQIANAIKEHYKECDLVDSMLKNDEKQIKIISDFLAKPHHETSFRTLNSIYDDAASSIGDRTSPVKITDILKVLHNKSAELKINNNEFNNLLKELNITPEQLAS